jgi:flavin reductase (DIM6/NTAB) family NADH-FMN oxidoreductase RutF
MGSFASSVSVITTRSADGEPLGMTCSAVCSVSADPPLLLTCVRPPSVTLTALAETGRFVVNFLDADGRELSDRFASAQRDKFAGVQWRSSDVFDIPVLEPVLAHAECRVHQLINAGDHVIVIGLIVAGGAASDRFPLGYWRGRYVRVFRCGVGPKRLSTPSPAPSETRSTPR